NYAIPVRDHIDIKGSNVLADRGYDSNQLLAYIYERGGEPTIPSRKGAKFERHCDWWLYKERQLVEKYFLKLKGFRRIASRDD
ncbi:transposase, partial [Blautia sp.]|uniref:transposase n=1 Tax=Blautia sp. TaxID=1955243 RepID=UPI0026356190